MRYQLIVLLTVVLAGAGCQKYKRIDPIPDAAYLRVFNGLMNAGSGGDSSTSRLLTMLIDPVMGSDSIPSGGSIVSDFLCLKSYYAAPFETHPDVRTNFYQNTEFPGSDPVRVGGAINGLDLGRWAQVPSGQHRIVFLRRVTTSARKSTYFINYVDQALRDSDFIKAFDTTVNLSAGAIYTGELLSADPTDAHKVSFHFRQENYDKEDFSDTSKFYVNFYNFLSAASSPDSMDVYVQVRYYINTVGPQQIFKSDIPLSYSAGPTQEGSWAHVTTVDTGEHFLTGVGRSDVPAHKFVGVPMPSADSFYYREGPAIGQYRLPFDRPRVLFVFYRPGQSSLNGTPLLTMSANEFNGPGLLNISVDNSPFYSQNTYEGTTGGTILTSPYQTITTKGVSRAFPMVNTIELMTYYRRINLPGTNIEPFQISLQRPFTSNIVL